MKKKSEPSRQPASAQTAADRVTWLLNQIWNGNKSEMARAIGVTHSVITKVAAGQQQAGRRLMAAIASHPKVNPAWLMTGQGEPLLASSQESPSDGWPVPIFGQLILGPPDQNRDLSSGESFPLPGSLYRQSRYWLRVAPGDSIVKHPTARIRPYDLLLIETDPRWWQSVETFDERICAVQLDPALRAQLGYVTWRSPSADEPEELLAELFDKQVERSKLIVNHRLRRLDATTDVAYDPFAMKVIKEAQGEKIVKKVSQIALAPVTDEISLSQVKAVCVLILRRQ